MRLSTRTAVRVVLVVGTLLIAGTLVLDMSRSAPRRVGSDRVKPLAFSILAKGGDAVCQPVMGLPDDAHEANFLIGTYYRPLPPIALSFRGANGALVALARTRGGHQGWVTIPIHRLSRAPVSTACLHIGGKIKVAIGGMPGPLLPVATLNGKPQGGTFTIFYYGRGSQNWWQLLPVVDQRFGWGKAPFFGNWTLPVVAALALLLWAGTLRFVAREFGRSRPSSR